MPRQTLSMENPLKKILTKISAQDLVISVLCFMLSKAKILTYMTPFGLAFFAASFSYSGWFYAMIAAAIGAITSHAGSDCVRYIISLALTSAVLGLLDLKKKTFLKALSVSLIYFFVSLFLLVADNFLLYDFIVQSFESFLCFVSVYAIESVTPVIVDYKKRTFLSHKEVMGVIAISALLTMSLSSAEIFGMNIDSLISIFIIMAISYRGDILISSVCGIIFGLALALSESGGVQIAGAYALAGFGAGFFSRYSRLGIVLGVTLANAVITAFMNNTANILINPIEVLVAGFIFATMPKKTVDIFADFASKASASAPYLKEAENVKNTLGKKLMNMSAAFERIAQVYRSDCYMRRPGKQYMTKLFDYAAQKSCSDCSMRFDCWQKDKRNTYAYMTSMLEIASSNGYLKESDLPERFAGRCVKKEEFIKNFNFMYDIYKTDKLWLEKMYETRILMVSQMQGVAKILECASKHQELSTNFEGESYIKAALDREGIKVREINVFEKDDEIKQVDITLDEREDENYLAEIVSDVIDMPFVASKVYETDIGVHYEICPCEQYVVQWAKAFECKNGENICGDSFVWLNVDASPIMAISDGMGSGKAAYTQSKDTLEMLSAFLEAGFDAKTAFELINSSLLLRSSKDCFSTIDMMSVDTKNGVINLSKIGAAPTYVKQGNNVKCYDCSTLPVGILRDVSAQFYRFDVQNHAMVVMMSDGISNTVIKSKNDWIENELKALNTHNPDLVAQKILDKAIKKSGGRIDDDMTVAVAVIYRYE